MADTSAPFKVGDRVRVVNTQAPGVVAFVGTTEFSSGVWVGVALNDPSGKNDGEVKGVRYFQCNPLHGIFVRPANLSQIDGGGNKQRSSLTPSSSPSSAQAEDTARRSLPTALVQAEAPTTPKVIQAAQPPPVDANAKARVQEQLAEAMEDHDVDQLRALLPKAARFGVPRSELDGAMRVLNFEVQSRLCKEIEGTRSVVSQLAETVCFAEARARQAEEAAAAARSGRQPTGLSPGTTAPPRATHANGSMRHSGDDKAWIEKVGAELEELVWAGLRRRVDEVVKDAVSQATQALVAAVEELKEAATDSAAALSQNQPTRRARFSDSHGKVQKNIEEIAKVTETGNAHTLTAEKARGSSQSISEQTTFVTKWLKDSAFCILGQRLDLLGHRRMQRKAFKRELILGGEVANKITVDRDDAAASKLQAMARGRLCRESRKKKQDASQAQAAKVEGFKQKRAVTSLQKYVRRRGAQRTQAGGDLVSLQNVVAAKVDQREQWKAVFDWHAEKDSNALLCGNFCASIREVHPRLTSGQALALWRGYTSGTGLSDVDWEGFYAISDAVAIDDHWAAEFAAMSSECFQQLGLDKADRMATKIQARVRGANVRKKKAESIPPPRAMTQADATIIIQKNVRLVLAKKRMGKLSFSSVACVVLKRYKAWVGPFNEAAGGAEYLDRQQFVNALFKASSLFNVAQAEALHEGYVSGTGLAGIDLRGFCQILECSVYDFGAVAEFADMTADAFAALGRKESRQLSTEEAQLIRLFDDEVGGAHLFADLRAFRRMAKHIVPGLNTAQVDSLWKSCEQTTKHGVNLEMLTSIAKAEGDLQSLAKLANMTKLAFCHVASEVGPCDAWRVDRPDLASLFDEAIGSSPNLNETTFPSAMLKAQPRLNRGQVSALWRGHTSRTNMLVMDLEDFGFCAEAVDEGDQSAAEFADMCVQSFIMLASGEKAATMIQARSRGKTARVVAKAKKEEKLSKAAVKLQTAVRGWKARRTMFGKRAGEENFFEAARLVTSKCKAWAAIFDEALKMQDGSKPLLLSGAFHVALVQAHPSISQAQVQALFEGITEGVSSEGISLKNFCHVVHALQVGDDRAAEFADMTEADFAALGRRPNGRSPNGEAVTNGGSHAAVAGRKSIEEVTVASMKGSEIGGPSGSSRLQRAGFFMA